MSLELGIDPGDQRGLFTLVVGSQIVGQFITVLALHYQKRYNRLHRSIYGLSYDTQWFQLLQHIISVYCSLNYRFNPIVRGQLQRRYPHLYADPTTNQPSNIPISWSMFIFDLLLSWNLFSLIRQLRRYGYTRHIHQGISSLATFIILTFIVVFGITTLWFAYWFGIHQNKDSGLLGIFWLDHINYLWLMSQVFHVWSFWPQLCINWMGKCCQGLSSRFVILSLLSSIIKFIGVTILNQKYDNTTGYYFWPFNLDGKYIIICELLSISLILLQAQYFYPNNKPYLPRQFEKILPYNHSYSIV